MHPHGCRGELLIGGFPLSSGQALSLSLSLFCFFGLCGIQGVLKSSTRMAVRGASPLQQKTARMKFSPKPVLRALHYVASDGTLVPESARWNRFKLLSHGRAGDHITESLPQAAFINYCRKNRCEFQSLHLSLSRSTRALACWQRGFCKLKKDSALSWDLDFAATQNQLQVICSQHGAQLSRFTVLSSKLRQTALHVCRV